MEDLHAINRIASPYDLDARWGVKREEFWLGYKLHITETCDDAPACTCRPAAGDAGGGSARDRGHDKGCAHLASPNLITHVATTDATVTDNQMTGVIHQDLAGRTWPPDGITSIRGTSAPRWWSRRWPPGASR